MKNRAFFSVLLVTFLLEIAILIFLIIPKPKSAQDAVLVNEAVQTVQSDWAALNNHVNHTSLDYVVLDSDENVLYKTRSGLSESMNAAIIHKDTILDIEIDNTVAGKLIVYNDDELLFQSEKQTFTFAVIAIMLLQCGICVGYFFTYAKQLLNRLIS